VGVVLRQAWSKRQWTVLVGYFTISTNVRRYKTHHRWHFVFQEDSAKLHCVCNTIQLSEKMWFSCFRVLPGNAEAQVVWGGTVKRLLIAYFMGNISVKIYQNPFMCIKVIGSQMWDVFWDTV